MTVVPIERRSFLFGALGGVGAGAVAGLGAGYVSGEAAPKPAPFGHGRFSYSQQGEDLGIESVFVFLGISRPTYLDIGAHHPVVGNNTYRFFLAGGRGVLVEPNPALAPKLRSVRPGDEVLEIGIGAREEDQEANYYVIEGDGQLNTFSEDEVSRLRAERGTGVVKSVMKRRLVNVNKVLAGHFPDGAPDLLSTDTEGYDLTILQSLDFDRFRPRVLCVETLAGLEVNEAIMSLLRAKEYEVRGGSFVNTIFVDKRWRRERKERVRHG
jgi:FkbM family methyltransferase